MFEISNMYPKVSYILEIWIPTLSFDNNEIGKSLLDVFIAGLTLS